MFSSQAQNTKTSMIHPSHHLMTNPNMLYSALHNGLLNYQLQQNKAQQLTSHNIPQSPNSFYIEMLARNNQAMQNVFVNQKHHMMNTLVPQENSVLNVMPQKIYEDSLKENKSRCGLPLKSNLKRNISEVMVDESIENQCKKPILKFGMDAILGNNNNNSTASSSCSTSPSLTKNNNFEENQNFLKAPIKNTKPSFDSNSNMSEYSYGSNTNQNHNNNNDVNTYQLQFGYNTTNDQQNLPNTQQSNQTTRQSFLNNMANTNPTFYQGNPYLNPMMWPLKAKQRRGVLRRAVFSDQQRKGLEAAFLKQKYINKPDRKKLAAKLCLKDSQVKIWFQNRRMKWRNTKERELMKARQAINKKPNDSIIDESNYFNESFKSTSVTYDEQKLTNNPLNQTRYQTAPYISTSDLIQLPQKPSPSSYLSSSSFSSSLSPSSVCKDSSEIGNENFDVNSIHSNEEDDDDDDDDDTENDDDCDEKDSNEQTHQQNNGSDDINEKKKIIKEN